MRALPLLLAVASALFAAFPAAGYQWYHVAVDTVDHPFYDIQFGGGTCYVGSHAGVFCGYGPSGPWKGMGLEYPGLGAYSILYREGSGWRKNVVNALALPGASGVGVADLDESGYADIVVAAKDPMQRVVWYTNPLPGPVSPSWDMEEIGAPALGAREVSIADIDLDGDLDVAAALHAEETLVWYEATSDVAPAWIRHNVGDPLPGARGVFVADINDDGRPDIVGGGMDAATVVWIEQPGLAGDPWVTHYVDLSLAGVKGVFACDLDLDGDLDIVAAGRDAGQVVWYEQADVVPWAKHLIDDSLPGAVSVWCGDLTGDGHPDVAATGTFAGSVVVYEAGGPGGIEPWIQTVVDDNLPGACGISAGDIDGDARTDLVATGKAAGMVVWYKAPPEGGHLWMRSVIDSEAWESMGVTTGDLDNDGDLDVVATTSLEGAVSWYENDLREIYCAFSDGTGGCLSDGIYRWHELNRGWVPLWWCPRPFFLEEDSRFPGTFYCGNNEGLFTSSDLIHWSEVGAWILPDTVQCIWFDPWDPNTLMVGTARGLYRTSDSGMHWGRVEDVPELPVRDIETVLSPGPPPWVPMVFLTEGMGTYTDGLYRSDDLGASWRRLTTIYLPTDVLQDYTLDGHGTAFLFLGTMTDGIYRASDEGEIFGSLNDGLPDLTIHRMDYDPYIDTPAIFACTEGGLYECLLLENTSVAAIPPAAGMLCRAWPNPWRETVSFSLSGLSDGDLVRISVYDPLGRRVWAYEARASRGGMWSAEWNGRAREGDGIPPGVYFYRVETPRGAHSGKVVRMR